MKQKTAVTKTTRAAEQSTGAEASAGPAGVALAPPAYGIDVVDRGLRESSPGNQGQAIQRKPAESAAKEGFGIQPNRTGLPDALKAGIEGISGLAMDNVRVHYNSSRPAQLQALAYTQGREIHVAPGQERHLPHEAWHVVQQAQGRVKPTMQMKDDVPVNDDEGLEHEADVMGEKALNNAVPLRGQPAKQELLQARFAPVQRFLNTQTAKVAFEKDPELYVRSKFLELKGSKEKKEDREAYARKALKKIASEYIPKKSTSKGGYAGLDDEPVGSVGTFQEALRKAYEDVFGERLAGPNIEETALEEATRLFGAKAEVSGGNKILEAAKGVKEGTPREIAKDTQAVHSIGASVQGDNLLEQAGAWLSENTVDKIRGLADKFSGWIDGVKKSTSEALGVAVEVLLGVVTASISLLLSVKDLVQSGLSIYYTNNQLEKSLKAKTPDLTQSLEYAIRQTWKKLTRQDRALVEAAVRLAANITLWIPGAQVAAPFLKLGSLVTKWGPKLFNRIRQAYRDYFKTNKQTALKASEAKAMAGVLYDHITAKAKPDQPVEASHLDTDLIEALGMTVDDFRAFNESAGLRSMGRSAVKKVVRGLATFEVLKPAATEAEKMLISKDLGVKTIIAQINKGSTTNFLSSEKAVSYGREADIKVFLAAPKEKAYQEL